MIAQTLISLAFARIAPSDVIARALEMADEAKRGELLTRHLAILTKVRRLEQALGSNRVQKVPVVTRSATCILSGGRWIVRPERALSYHPDEPEVVRLTGLIADLRSEQADIETALSVMSDTPPSYRMLHEQPTVV